MSSHWGSSEVYLDSIGQLIFTAIILYSRWHDKMLVIIYKIGIDMLEN